MTKQSIDAETAGAPAIVRGGAGAHSAHYDAALSGEQRQVFLAAGEGLLAQFHGTDWAISIISGVGALFLWVPYIGLVALFVLGTVVGVVGSVLCGGDLLRLSNKVTERSNLA